MLSKCKYMCVYIYIPTHTFSLSLSLSCMHTYSYLYMYTYTNTYKIKYDMHIDMCIYRFIYVHCPSCHRCHRLCHCDHRCFFFVVTAILGTCVSFFHILGTCLTLYSSLSFMLLAGFSCSWCILLAMQAMWGDSRPPILSSSFTLRHLTTSMFSKSTLSKAPLDAKQNSMESNSGRWTLQCCKNSLVVWMVALLAWKTRSKLLCSSGFMRRNVCSGTSPTLSLPMPA